MDGRDYGDFTLVDGRESCVAASVCSEQCVKALGVLHLFDINTCIPATALGTQNKRTDLLVSTG
ncbi:unannotated protein [freshwater metagenome]|uniref:Unannotated protein n=1 Tax=freshwater metagenome TaxID=449393 RepID=A0A6J7PAW6_9ZZZZ